MSEKKDYFDYVENVLGVKSILLNQTSQKEALSVPLLVYVENLENYNPEEKDLLAKMIGALKIDLQLIKVLSLNESEKIRPDYSIYFLDDVKQDISNQMNIVKTYSPRFLLKNSDYKKNAWNDLQEVIRYFKHNN